MLSESQSATQPTGVPFPVRRFTVGEYRRMAERGILSEEDRVELLDGIITPKMVHNPPHDLAVSLTDELLRNVLPADWKTRVQSATTMFESEPEPDIAAVRGPLRTYASRHPGPVDIGLIVEVAETSVNRDRNKRAIYARAEIPVYWIVNLVEEQVEVYTDPSGKSGVCQYATEQFYQPGDIVTLTIDGQELPPIAVNDLLP